MSLSARRSRTALAALAVAVAATGTGVVVLAADSAPPAAVAAADTDEGAALQAARRTRQPVRIDSQTTETAEVWARPDGQFEARLSAGIVRMRRGTGWVPVDVALRAAADGSVTPVAHPNDLRISGARPAGTHELASVGRGADRVAMSWTGALPAPELDGTRATYRNALPGVDLVVRATRTGFEQSLVVGSRAAVARVQRVRLALTGRNVAAHRTDAAGTLTLADRAGAPLVTVPAPAMWDSRTNAAGTPARVARIRTVVANRPGGVDLELRPDLAWLRSPATVFPVTLDPTVVPALKTTFDTWVQQGSAAVQNAAEDLRIGLMGSTPPVLTRSFITWDTGVLVGKQINSATVNLWNWYSSTCAAKSWEIWRTTAAAPGTVWDNQPQWLERAEAVTTATKGFDASCADGWTGVDGTSFFQKAANTPGGTRAHMGLRATDETDTKAFKQFRSRDAGAGANVPTAVVTYNAYPLVTGRATVPATACATGAARPLVNTLTPQFKATVADADATGLTVDFEWWPVGGSARIGGQTLTGIASGATATVTVPAGAFVDGGRYQWRVKASDGVAGSSNWSPFCELTTYVTVPPVDGCTRGADHDYNGDGVRDVAIADPEADVDGAAGAGNVRIVYGGTGAVQTVTENNARAAGASETGDRFGHALATYDANHDGCSDLVVGTPYEDLNNLADAGAVYVLLGAPAGLTGGPASLAWHQDSAGFADALEASDNFGFSVTAGQTASSEGYLAIGVPGEDIGTGVDAGLVHYLRGSANAALYVGSGVTGGAENDDRLGYSLASSPSHLAIGSPGEALGAVAFAGVVHLYTHELVAGLPRSLGTLGQDVSEVAEPNDNFGKSIAMVPYRAAGAAPGPDSLLIVGVPGEDVGAVQDAGMVHRYQVTATAGVHLGAVTQDTPGVGGGAEDGDYFGERVHLVNTRPGEPATAQNVQVAVGTPGEDLGDVADAGGVYVFAGVTNPIPPSADLSRDGGSLPGQPVAQELIGLALGGSPEHLYVASPYGDATVHAIAWVDLAAGNRTPSRSWKPGANGIPAGEHSFGAAIG